MRPASLPPCTVSTAPTWTAYPLPKSVGFSAQTSARNRWTICRASSASSSSSITDFDLYDLLGIDSTSDQSRIKLAYRALQKRCHPDVAGPGGHDLAIILNEAYSVLSDPDSRMAYDKEQAKVAELRGYTGRPIYSVWFGSESEERAVFVDEVKCVGCLKCALLAEKTFAVESVYGRARVVAQWADPENKIQEAIEACPVDCISIVERSNLAALEFLMSKQPRGSVRVGAGNTVGARVSNIFVDVEKFQSRFLEALHKTSTRESKVSDAQREARISAIQAIRSISNWLYWQMPGAPKAGENLMHAARKSTEPNIKKLQEAAMARKHARATLKATAKIPSNYMYSEDYWIPSTLALPQPTIPRDLAISEAASEPAPIKEQNRMNAQDFLGHEEVIRTNPAIRLVPVAAAAIAAVIVGLQVQEGASSGLLTQHIGGPFALDIVNSPWQPAILAGIVWYLIAGYTVALSEPLLSKMMNRRK